MDKSFGGKKLTSKEAARLLGVSEASVKRWADGGLLPMEKTAGGHRRFRPEDVALVRRKGRPAVRTPARAAIGQEFASGQEAALLEETFRALLDRREEELSALLVKLYLHGQSVGAIADGLLCAAMRRVGDLWHAGELSVAQEHVATRTATGALRKLQAALDVPSPVRASSALCCSVEGDFHELPLRLAALTLEACGLAVFDLGTSTPFSALSEALERFRPDVVCVSSTVLVGLDRAAREYAEFNRAARRFRATVVLGGAGFADACVRRRLPADLHAGSFRQLEGFVATLAANEA